VRREISPLDGRYADKLGELAICSAKALMRSRASSSWPIWGAGGHGRFFALDAPSARRSGRNAIPSATRL
jgi:hypothetical protein